MATDMWILIWTHGKGPKNFNLINFYADMDIWIWICACGKATLYSCTLCLNINNTDPYSQAIVTAVIIFKTCKFRKLSKSILKKENSISTYTFGASGTCASICKLEKNTN